MKAIVQDEYGTADDLEFADIDRPAAGSGEVLVRVHAASVFIGDWHVVTGRPSTSPRDLSSVAQAGQVIVSEAVALESAGVRFEEIGPVALKGVTVPMRLFLAVR